MAKCQVEDCLRNTIANGYCRKHYMAVRRYGSPNGKARNARGVARRHPLHDTWLSMRQRCFDPGHESFKNYGARGITICDRWIESFWDFVDDMGPKPSRQHSLDRRDNNGDYEPENCRWATQAEQHANRRNTRVREPDQERIMQLLTTTDLPVRQIALQLGLDYEATRLYANGQTFNRPIKSDPAPHPSVEDMRFQPSEQAAVCELDNCSREVYASGLCRKHYRWRHEGQTVSMVDPLPTVRICETCGGQIPEKRRITAKWCSTNCKMAWHRKHGSYAPHNRLADQPACSVESCDRPARCKGMCQSHYMRSYHQTKSTAAAAIAGSDEGN